MFVTPLNPFKKSLGQISSSDQRGKKRKEALDGGRAIDEYIMVCILFIECKISIGKYKNDIQGKFRVDF